MHLSDTLRIRLSITSPLSPSPFLSLSLSLCPIMRGTLILPSAVHSYVAPVPSTLFLTLWIGLLAAGIAATGWFFVYEVSVSSRRRSIFKESAIAVSASSLLGFGVIFLMLWAGVWV